MRACDLLFGGRTCHGVRTVQRLPALRANSGKVSTVARSSKWQNEDENIAGGLRCLRQLYEKFGDWSKAVQAYNSGPGNVLRGIVPAETADYVPEVMGRASELNGACPL